MNFRKANWELFTAETERGTPARTSHAASTNTIHPRMGRGSCNHLLSKLQQATTKKDIDTTATSLFRKHDEVRRVRYRVKTESVNFTY